ncbi:hypothetical protein [Burkholderia sp. S171]|uniref:hypothetical protein n=1 Tax=Burkholderia sp. S171 TaxID=1641860 RepID=UPI00131D4AA8|nr:hypothetical protein [Burkholderia sp. S171]
MQSLCKELSEECGSAGKRVEGGGVRFSGDGRPAHQQRMLVVNHRVTFSNATFLSAP